MNLNWLITIKKWNVKRIGEGIPVSEQIDQLEFDKTVQLADKVDISEWTADLEVHELPHG
jgi:HSP20 family molecular chaperone IbpA